MSTERKFIASMPKDLTKEEFGKMLFERIYGAPMEDFLSGKVNDSMINYEDCT